MHCTAIQLQWQQEEWRNEGSLREGGEKTLFMLWKYDLQIKNNHKNISSGSVNVACLPQVPWNIPSTEVIFFKVITVLFFFFWLSYFPNCLVNKLKAILQKVSSRQCTALPVIGPSWRFWLKSCILFEYFWLCFSDSGQLNVWKRTNVFLLPR